MPRLHVARFLPAGWLILLALFGGASRHDEWQQLVVTGASAGILLAALWKPDWAAFRAKRALWIFLAIVAVMIAAQLVPLPPSVWTRLPGRTPFLSSGTLAGLGDVWRPASLTPDLTWAALYALLPVAATLAVAPLPKSAALRPLVWALLAIFSLGALLGIAQALGGDGLTLFQRANVGSAVGVFANRNHHAIFLTLAFPFVAYFITAGRPTVISPLGAVSIGACMTVLYTVSIVQAGSRSGLVLGAIMLSMTLAAIALNFFPVSQLFATRRRRSDGNGRRSRRAALLGIGASALAVGLIVVVVRSVAFDRLVQFDVTYDFRARVLPLLLKMAETFAPFGSGYGSFSTVYRYFEPFETLRHTYFNQAHNDVIQVLIEGGVAGLVLMAAGVSGLLWRAVTLVRATRNAEQMIGIVGCMVIGALFSASFADYPLRTPFLAGILTFAAVFLARPVPGSACTGGETRLPSMEGLPRGEPPKQMEELA